MAPHHHHGLSAASAIVVPSLTLRCASRIITRATRRIVASTILSTSATDRVHRAGARENPPMRPNYSTRDAPRMVITRFPRHQDPQQRESATLFAQYLVHPSSRSGWQTSVKGDVQVVIDSVVNWYVTT